MSVTMKDIAKATGLGIGTVSAYMNGQKIREKNKELIEAAIIDLNFEINEMARSLKTNKTKIIGIIIPELTNIFFAEIVTCIEDKLREKGYGIILCDCRSDLKREKEAMDFLYKKRVDGLILIPTSSKHSTLGIFLESNKPLIVIDRELDEKGCDYILVNHKKAMYEATESLIKKGHKAIGIIAGPEDNSSAVERLEGYKEALESYKIPLKEEYIAYSDYTVQGGMKAMEKLLDIGGTMKVLDTGSNSISLPSSVIITNYDSTLGAMIGIHQRGTKIPKDLSVIGYDSLLFAKASNPRLEVVLQPVKEIGNLAGERMLVHLQNKEHIYETFRLEGDRVEGDSVRAKN